MTLTLSSSSDAEEGIVGACLLATKAVEVATRLVTPGDFGTPGLANAFEAIVRLHARGVAVDTTMVVHELRSMGLEWDEAGQDCLRWMSAVPTPGHIGHYAELVVRYSAKRRLAAIGAHLANAAQDAMTDPGDLAEEAVMRITGIDSPALGQSPGDLLVEEFLAQPESAMAPVVIPGLLTLDDRVVIVAPEGVGKSEFTRQMAVLPTWGIHPLTFERCPAIPTLLVDLENPTHAVRRRLDYLTSVCSRRGGIKEAGTLWHRPGGIDLRRRVDRLAFEDVLRRRRPSLVALGPLYKAYQRKSSENDEQVAGEVQAILDDLRTRFGFALLLEHHAPHAAAGSARDLRPYGSSLWLRWPEFGLKLIPDKDDKNVLNIGRWREDRIHADWPDALVRGNPWPWMPTETEQI